MSLRIRGTLLKIHGVLPLLWLITCFTGAGARLIPALLALLLHESGHILMAKCIGLRVESIEITPYGGVIAIENMEHSPPLSAFLLAAAGPLFSLLGCALSIWLAGHSSAGMTFSAAFARSNLLLLLLNLLPALPLDGGRMLRAALHALLPYSRATKMLTLAGSVLGALLCLLSIFLAFQGQINFSPAFAGMYLLYAASLESRQGTARYVTALISRRQRLDQRDILPMEMLAAGESTPVRAVLGRMSAGKYHLLVVLSEDGLSPLGVLDENEYCAALLRCPEAKLRDCMGQAGIPWHAKK